ncbi:MAG: response regulator [Bacteroidota bacterium]|nr:response regulator [Bacteroidota bacterium]
MSLTNKSTYNLVTPLKILLADDDRDDRFMFQKALKALPVTTNLTTVYDGVQLMKYLSENSEHLPDVLFLDINMPRKNGFECLLEIKESETLKELPVVMFSTSYPRDMNYERDIINSLLEMGAYDYIRKPDDFSQLKQTISNAIAIATGNSSLIE